MRESTLRSTGRVDVVARLRELAVSMCAGAVAGLAIGGVGGRIAMLVLRLTSNPNLHGLETDDGFTIGVVSGATAFLLMLTAALGGAGGALYHVIRPVLTERSAPWVAGILGALVGGAAIIRPGGIDFTLLDPIPLAVALFVAIPAAGAAGTSALAERWLRRERRSIAWFAIFVPFGLAGLRAPLSTLAIFVVLVLAVALPEPSWTSDTPVPRAIVLVGRAAIAAIAILATIALAKDVAAIL